MATFTLINDTNKDHLVQFKMNFRTDDGWFEYDSDMTRGNVSLESNEDTKTLSVCLASMKGPSISCVGSTSEIYFSDFLMNSDREFKGKVYINGGEYDISDYYSLLDILSESPIIQLVTYNNEIVIHNKISSDVKIAIEFEDASELDYYSFKEEQDNETGFIDYDSKSFMFCLATAPGISVNSPSNLFVGVESRLSLEVWNSSGPLEERHLEIYCSDESLIEFTQIGVEYTNPSGGYYSYNFIPNALGLVSFDIYYKGMLLNSNSYEIRTAPKLNLTLAGLKEYNYYNTSFTPSVSMSDNSSFGTVYYEMQNISSAWPQYSTSSILYKDSYGKIVAQYPGQARIRAYTHHYNTGITIYSDWTVVNVFCINFQTNGVSGAYGLDLGQSKTYKIVLEGIDYLPEGWQLKLSPYYSSVPYTNYFDAEIVYGYKEILLKVKTKAVQRNGYAVQIGVYNEEDVFITSSALTLYINPFEGDIAAFSLTESGDTIRIVGKVFTYEDVTSIKVEQHVSLNTSTYEYTKIISTIDLNEDKTFSFNVKQSDWDSSISDKRMCIYFTKPSGDNITIWPYVRPTSPLVLKFNKENSAYLTNSESVTNFTRTLLEYEDGTLEFPESRSGTRSFDLQNQSSATPIIKLHSELYYEYSSKHGRFRISDKDTSKPSLLEIISFGTGQLKYAPSFYNCRGLVKVPTSIPNEWIATSYMFQECRSLNDSSIANWNMRNIINADLMFYNAYEFNVDLSRWCVTKLLYTPSGFDSSTKLTTAMRPKWGTCPLG